MRIKIDDLDLTIKQHDWKSFVCHETDNEFDIYATISGVSVAEALGLYIIKILG